MAELLAANQITIAKVLDGADGEMSAEQLAQLNQASSDASEAKTDASTAKTTAQTANSTAQSAQNSASQAQTKAEQALKASSVTTETLKAESARIDSLETGKANIADLNAEKARIDTLETNKADISTLNAETARIDNLIATKASIESLDAESARINNLESTKADITSLNAGIARIDTLEAGKADIDLANVNNAWITNGVIKDASIANEKVISVSANKLTAGTIDASKITVTNLNADNITVGTINGARIGNNSIDLNKLSQEVPTKEYLDSVEQKLQGEIDGAIETFTVSEIPTLNNEPAVNWTTDDIKSTHVGDLCYVVNNASDNDGFCYRFQYNGTVYSWALIKDNDVTKAIQDIAELGGEVTQFKTDYTSKVSEIDGGIESLKSRTTTIETTYSTKTYTDTKTSDALTSANSYADTKASSTLTDAKSYADSTASTKVETSVFNTLKNTVDENSANITSLTETVTTKADNSTVTTLSNTVNEVKQTADDNSSSISNLTTTVNSKADGSKVTALETKTSTIEQNLSGVATRVTNLESENDGLDTRLTTAESKITDDAIVSTVTSSKTYKDALSGKVDTSVYNTKMEQLDDSISLKATATDVYTKTQANAAFDAKGSAATAKSEAISSANSYTDTATTDMATEEFVTSQGYLTVTSDAITSKVSKNEVISAINQTAESVSIDANKINLNGAVTISSLDNSLQTTINNKAETSELEGVRTIANNAQTSINNLEIGGRNLLLNSGFKDNADGWDYPAYISEYVVKDRRKCAHINHSELNDIKFARQSILGKLEPNTQYTMSGWFFTENVVKGTTNFMCMFRHDGQYDNNGTTGWYNYGYKDIPINAGKWTHVEWTFTTDSENTLNAISSNVYVYTRDMTGDVYFCDLKFEKGNKATDWTPAPEDVDAGIANASKVATNFLEYDSTNGLIVGNKTSGSWSGYRSQILPGSFNVLDSSSTVLASFGPTTIIGEEANANIHLTFNNFSMLNKENSAIFEVGDTRNAEGIATVKHTAVVVADSAGTATVTVKSFISSIVSVYADSVQLSSSRYSFDSKTVTINGLTANSKKTIEITYTTTESTVYLTFGERDSSGNIGKYSIAEGIDVIASGSASHAEGDGTTAGGECSHAEGDGTTAKGWASHAEGRYTKANEDESHAEGYNTSANGWASHAEGRSANASGMYSHAEGYYTKANEWASHAEGYSTTASATGAHAGGLGTVADGEYMTAIGQHNTKNSGKAFVIGNGTSDTARSDAFTVDWNGNTVMKGGLALGTALSIANGGTGATTAAAARSNLGINDYIVEQGTTDGWDYIKFASRKFITWKRVLLTFDCKTASGSVYYSDTITLNLPFTIVDGGVANISLHQQCFASNVFVSTTAVSFRAIRGMSATCTDVNTHVVVYGTY